MARTRLRRRGIGGWLAIAGVAAGIFAAAMLGGSALASADDAKSTDTSHTRPNAHGPAKSTAAAAPRAAAANKIRRSRASLASTPTSTTTVPTSSARSTAASRTTALPAANWERDQVLFTGKPSLLTTLLVEPLRVISTLANLIVPADTSAADAAPPCFTTIGLDVTRGEAQGMPEWTISDPNSSGPVVVAIHGGGYFSQPSLFHWLTYAELVRQTGATVVIPMYSTVSEGATAQVVVPQMTQYLQDLVTEFGADNVSVMGDSAGGGLALAAVQQIVLEGGTPPARMVLISPWLDISMSDPAIPLTYDPIALPAAVNLANSALQWSAGLDVTDPWISPLYGPLAGLPQTTVYAGGLDAAAPDVLRLRDKAIADGVDISFVLAAGEWHVWPLGVVLPEAVEAMHAIYGQLGLVG